MYEPSADSYRDIMLRAYIKRIDIYRIAEPTDNLYYSYGRKWLGRRVNISSVDGLNSEDILIFLGGR